MARDTRWLNRRHPTASSLGTRQGVITPDNDNDLPVSVKAIEVIDVTNGTLLSYLPEGNADGEWITIPAVYVGYVAKVRVRRIRTTTTCQVVYIDD